MLLVDTNIFLEILLNQSKKEDCKDFLASNEGNLFITDFSLHSIGVILFKNNKEKVFSRFIEDVLPRVNLITLSERNYKKLSTSKKDFDLDFDDAYQLNVALENKLKIATMDRDFEKVSKILDIIFF